MEYSTPSCTSNLLEMEYQTRCQTCAFEHGDFFSNSDEEFLKHIHSKYPEELRRLTRAYSIRTLDNDFSSALVSPSYTLFGTNYDEVNRTLVGVLALRWLHNGQYGTFVRNQPEAVRLTRDSFDWMREVFFSRLATAQDLDALVMSMVVNDLGKDPQLASDYRINTGQNISNLNHDMILLKAVKVGLVPCLNRLSQDHRADIIKGMELGAEFNFGQLAQSENVPACLAGLIDMRNHPRAFDLRFMEQLLDVAGASGHMDWTCAKKLIQPIFEAYRAVRDVCMAIISERYGLREGYDIILVRRAKLLHDQGFRQLNVTAKADRALMRLLCMGGVSDLDTAHLYNEAWESLDGSLKSALVYSLNVEGSISEPAVQPTYMPALLTQGLFAVRSKSKGERKGALQIMFQYLVYVMDTREKPATPASVLERSMLRIVNETIKSPEFQFDPAILLKIKVPKSEIAKV
jgi:hypothetical protein